MYLAVVWAFLNRGLASSRALLIAASVPSLVDSYAVGPGTVCYTGPIAVQPARQSSPEPGGRQVLQSAKESAKEAAAARAYLQCAKTRTGTCALSSGNLAGRCVNWNYLQ